MSYLLEHTAAYPGVEVRQNYLRDYPLGVVGAHFLGQLGEISPHELTEASFRGYQAGDVVGQSGVEYTYDRWLRGINGSVRVEVDASGRPKQVVAGGTLPQAGDNLQLSIDAKVQRAAENAVNYGIDLAHADNEQAADGGAAVVLDAHTGEVIAMASEPTFNPAWFVGGLSAKHWKKLNIKTTPLLDRTIQGVYPMGSTFKVVDSIAALENGVISPSTTLEAGRHLHQPRPAVARLEPQRSRRHRPDPGHRAVGRHVLLPDRLRLLPAPRQRPSRTGPRTLAWATRPASTCPARSAAWCPRPTGSTRPTPRRPIPRAGRSTASGSRATRSTSPSARATSSRRPCRPP